MPELIVGLALDNKKYKTGLSGAETDTKRFKSAVDAGDGSVRKLETGLDGAAASTNKLRTGLKSSEPALDKLHAGLSKAQIAAGALGLALVGAAVGLGVLAVKGFQSSVKAASDLGESVNAVSVVFGESAEKMADFGATAAEQVGLSTRAFNELATPLGAILKNAGIPLDQVTDSTIELTTRAADMASVFNTSVADALGAIQAGLRGEQDPLEKYGVSLSAVKVEEAAMAQSGKKNAAALTDQEKMLARMSLILKQTQANAGDFRNTSDGLANSMRIQAAQSENLAARIGEKLIPIQLRWNQAQFAITNFAAEHLLPVMNEVADAIGNIADRAAGFQKNLGLDPVEATLRAIDQIVDEQWGKDKAKAFEEITQGASDTVDKIGEMKDAVVTAKEVIGPAAVGMAVAFGVYTFAAGLATAGTWSLNAAMEANPIVLVVSLIAGLTAATITLWNTNKDFRDFITGMWDGIKEAIKQATIALEGFITPLREALDKAGQLRDRLTGGGGPPTTPTQRELSATSLPPGVEPGPFGLNPTVGAPTGTLPAGIDPNTARKLQGLNIPSLASGGVVPGRFGEAVLAIVHGGEEFAGVGNHIGGTGGHGELTVNLNAYGATLDEQERNTLRVVKDWFEDRRRESGRAGSSLPVGIG